MGRRRRGQIIRDLLGDMPLNPDVQPGQVFTVPDHVIEFQAAATRTRHEIRYCIVVQAPELNRHLPTIQVVPCTSQVPPSVPDHEMFVPAGVAGFPHDTLALVSITQPIPRMAIPPQTVGALPESLMEELEHRVAKMHGVQSSLSRVSESRLLPSGSEE